MANPVFLTFFAQQPDGKFLPALTEEESAIGEILVNFSDFDLPSPAYEIQNVHFNQGNPNGSPYYNENGAWQDGGILIASNSSEKSSYILIKFKSQTFEVDEKGNPK